MMLTAFALGLSVHWYRPPPGPVTPEISWIGVVVLMFAAIVPSAPSKTLVAGADRRLDESDRHADRASAARGTSAREQRAADALSRLPAGRRRRRHLARRDQARPAGREGARDGQLPARRAARPRRHGRGLQGHASHAGAAGGDQADPAGDAAAREDGERRSSPSQRFRREAEAAANLRSPHTVELYDFGVTEDQTLYFVMELLDGMDLETLVRAARPAAGRRGSIHILRQVCESLEEAHARGLVHRDIKPANIHVGRLGLQHDFVKVLDFGLVKSMAARARAVAGHRGRARRRARRPTWRRRWRSGETVDGRADIYALGCVAYYPAHRRSWCSRPPTSPDASPSTCATSRCRRRSARTSRSRRRWSGWCWPAWPRSRRIGRGAPRSWPRARGDRRRAVGRGGGAGVVGGAARRRRGRRDAGHQRGGHCRSMTSTRGTG